MNLKKLISIKSSKDIKPIIGMRVKVLIPVDDNLDTKNKFATIKKLNTTFDLIHLEFDCEIDGGHSCSDLCKPDCGWNARYDEWNDGYFEVLQ